MSFQAGGQPDQEPTNFYRNAMWQPLVVAWESGQQTSLLPAPVAMPGEAQPSSAHEWRGSEASCFSFSYISFQVPRSSTITNENVYSQCTWLQSTAYP